MGVRTQVNQPGPEVRGDAAGVLNDWMSRGMRTPGYTGELYAPPNELFSQASSTGRDALTQVGELVRGVTPGMMELFRNPFVDQSAAFRAGDRAIQGDIGRGRVGTAERSAGYGGGSGDALENAMMIAGLRAPYDASRLQTIGQLEGEGMNRKAALGQAIPQVAGMPIQFAGQLANISEIERAARERGNLAQYQSWAASNPQVANMLQMFDAMMRPPNVTQTPSPWMTGLNMLFGAAGAAAPFFGGARGGGGGGM
jgi:hypothetical protein